MRCEIMNEMREIKRKSERYEKQIRISEQLNEKKKEAK